MRLVSEEFVQTGRCHEAMRVVIWMLRDRRVPVSSPSGIMLPR